MAIFRKELREMLGEESWEDEKARLTKESMKRAKRRELRRKVEVVWDRFWEIMPIVYFVFVVWAMYSITTNVRDYFKSHPTDIHIHIGGDK